MPSGHNRKNQNKQRKISKKWVLPLLLKFYFVFLRLPSHFNIRAFGVVDIKHQKEQPANRQPGRQRKRRKRRNRYCIFISTLSLVEKKVNNLCSTDTWMIDSSYLFPLPLQLYSQLFATTCPPPSTHHGLVSSLASIGQQRALRMETCLANRDLSCYPIGQRPMLG